METRPAITSIDLVIARYKASIDRTLIRENLTRTPYLRGAPEGGPFALVSGRLYLGVNDDHLADNSDDFQVMVTGQGQ